MDRRGLRSRSYQPEVVPCVGKFTKHLWMNAREGRMLEVLAEARLVFRQNFPGDDIVLNWFARVI